MGAVLGRFRVEVEERRLVPVKQHAQHLDFAVALEHHVLVRNRLHLGGCRFPIGSELPLHRVNTDGRRRGYRGCQETLKILRRLPAPAGVPDQ